MVFQCFRIPVNDSNNAVNHGSLRSHHMMFDVFPSPWKLKGHSNPHPPLSNHGFWEMKKNWMSNINLRESLLRWKKMDNVRNWNCEVSGQKHASGWVLLGTFLLVDMWYAYSIHGGYSNELNGSKWGSLDQLVPREGALPVCTKQIPNHGCNWEVASFPSFITRW